MGNGISIRALAGALLLAAAAGCSDEPQVGGPPAVAEWANLIGAPARVAWVEPKDNPNDVFLRGTNHVLMGFDSVKGRPHVIASPGGQVIRPLISPDGSYVVYSRRTDERMFKVAWTGGMPRTIGTGIALKLHRDPATGRDWVYAAQELATNEEDHYRRLIRHPVDNPNQPELVTDIAAVAIEGIGVSRDGDLLVGLFPWPRAFLHRKSTGAITPLGRGCWTAMAPDNSGLSWVFQGSHREFTMHALDGSSWEIAANTAPGIHGAKVYHPRWSNHTRYFIVTGPYRTESMRKLAPDAGQGVELYVGRFSEDFRSIEAWGRVTSNATPEYAPDLWVQGGDTSVVGASVATNAAPAAAPAAEWPGPADGLLYAWAHAIARNDVPNPAGGGRIESIAEPSGHARLSRTFGMLIRDGGYAAPGRGPDIAAAFAAHDAFTLEAVITPDAATSGEATVVALPGVTLVQSGDRLVARGGADVPLVTLPIASPTHLHVVYKAGSISVFTGGVRIASAPFTPTFDAAADLRFGFSSWRGELDHVSIRSIALTDAAITSIHASLASNLAARTSPQPIRTRGRVVEATPVPDAESIAPYRRALGLYVYELEPGEPDLEGSRRIQVYHWVMFDGVPVASAPTLGDVRELQLTGTLDHPELESERRLIGTDSFDLPEFLDQSW